MNLFEEVVLPKLWKDAVSGVTQDILARELNHYHLYAKNPDTGENFRRFYRHVEPLHAFLANKTAQEWLSGSSESGLLIQQRINSYSKGLDVELFFRKCNKIAVLKGTIDLAHGDVLKTQVKNLLTNEKSLVGVIFIDYSSPEGLSVDVDFLNGLNCLFLGGVQNLKDRYLLIAHGIASADGAAGSKEIIWWGIPFGMIFVFTLSKLMLLGGKNSLQGGNELKVNVFSRSLLTVKHHFSFSNKYIDRIYTSAPLVGGFEEIAKPKLIQFKPSFYSQDQLEGSFASLSLKESDIIRHISNFKSSGAMLFSSASRVEKTDNKRYLCAVEEILDADSAYCFVCFGKKMTPEYKQIMYKYGKNRVLFVGWLSPSATVKIIGMLDLFLDPFPFGAGMTFASAAFQKIPIISTNQFVALSPSSISVLYYYFKAGAMQTLSNKNMDNLFGSSTTIAKRAISCLNSSVLADTEELKSIIFDVFMNTSSSILST